MNGDWEKQTFYGLAADFALLDRLVSDPLETLELMLA